MHSNTLYLYFIIFVSTFQKIGNVDANDVKIDITTEEIDEARINKVVNNYFMEEDRNTFNSTQLKAVKNLIRQLLMKNQRTERQMNQLKQDKKQKVEQLKQEKKQEIEQLKQEKKDEVDLLKQEHNQKIETLDRRIQNYSKNVGALENNLKKETKIAWTYQAKLNIPKIVQNFIDECFPAWLERPKNKDELYSVPSLEKVLLNLENPKIKSLKRNLRKQNMTEDTFVNTIMNYVNTMTNHVNHILARERAYIHSLITGAEQDTANDHSINCEYAVAPTTVTALRALLLFGQMQSKDGPILEPYAHEDHIIEAEIEAKLEMFKIMQIDDIISIRTENTFKMQFEIFVKKINKVNKLDKPLKIPTSYYIRNQTTLYLLFDSFKDAKNMFNHLNDFASFVHFKPTERNAIIRNISEVGDELLPQGYGAVKIEINEETVNKKIKKGLQKKIMENNLLTLPKDFPFPRVSYNDDKKTSSIFLVYSDMENLMMVYQICKNSFTSANITLITEKLPLDSLSTLDMKL